MNFVLDMLIIVWYNIHTGRQLAGLVSYKIPIYPLDSDVVFRQKCQIQLSECDTLTTLELIVIFGHRERLKKDKKNYFFILAMFV